MTPTRITLLAAAACLAAAPAVAFPPVTSAAHAMIVAPRQSLPNLAAALAAPAKLPPIVVTPLTPAEQAAIEKAAAASAAAFRQQFPHGFPGGDLAPAAATAPGAGVRPPAAADTLLLDGVKWTYTYTPPAAKPPAPARPADPRTLPPGSWTRADGPVVAEVRVLADAIQFVAAPAAGRPGATLTVTADYAVAAGGGSVFGVVTHCDLAGGTETDRAKHAKMCDVIEGTPFAVPIRFVNGDMLVGRPKVAGKGGPQGFDLPFLAGTFKPAAGNAVVQTQAAAPVVPPAPPAPVALGGIVGQELGLMVGDMAGRPKAGAVVGSAVGAAVATALSQRAADDGARSALDALHSVAGWLGLRTTADAPAVVVVP